MKIFSLICAFVAMISALPISAQSQILTDDLKEFCSSEKNSYEYAICQGYVIGVLDEHISNGMKILVDRNNKFVGT
ncbi:MAG: hypothetical protein RLP45_04750, partial [Haliea sp.]